MQFFLGMEEFTQERPFDASLMVDFWKRFGDEAIRNHVEGKFGQAKRRFGLGRIMAKLASTSAAQISLSFLVMNLEEALRRFLFVVLFTLSCLGQDGFRPMSTQLTRIATPEVAVTARIRVGRNAENRDRSRLGSKSANPSYAGDSEPITV